MDDQEDKSVAGRSAKGSTPGLIIDRLFITSRPLLAELYHFQDMGGSGQSLCQTAVSHGHHICLLHTRLHRHREIVGSVRRVGDLLRGQAENAPGGILVPADLHDVQLGGGVDLLLLEAQHLESRFK